MISSGNLSRILARLFSDDSEREQVMAILDTYGKGSHEKESSRVKLAILKLAGNNRKEVEKYTAIAKQDFRDVLSWAEYPRQSRLSTIPEGPDKERLIREDRTEYESWLEQ